MISVSDALQRIQSTISHLSSEKIAVSEALNYTLSESVFSKIDMPPFDQSAMDGYALSGSDLKDFKIVGEIQAGEDASKVVLQKGEAVRIFTGAMVPKTATTVVKQEITARTEMTVSVLEEFQSGTNIRRASEQIKAGELALSKGTKLNAAAIGFLGMLGIEMVSVIRKPTVKLLITGNELVASGKPLSPGKIYESNSVTLLAALKQFNIEAKAFTVDDNYDTTFTTIKSLLNSCDLLITSGGISVGDYDFVGKALKENGVNEVFYKVKQKPGKPLFFGTSKSCHVFALPGNPASALTGLYLYVYPAIAKMMGNSPCFLPSRMVQLNQDYAKTSSMTHFLKGSVSENTVDILENQSSAMLNSFAAANCLIQIDEGQENWQKGDLVKVILLP